MTNKTYSFLGLAAKAGKLISGYHACEAAIKSGKAHLVIIAENESQNTRKRFSDACEYRGVPIRFFGEKELIGRSTGKDVRAVVAVADREFAKRLAELIDNCCKVDGGELIG